MLAQFFVRVTRLDRLERKPDASDSAVAVAFSARFFDELLAGAWTVLSPTFRQVFGLSFVQIGLLHQVLTWVANVVEPVAASLIDFRSRRQLMGFGAAAVAASVLVMAGAPSFAVLLVGFAAYGLGSGPLAHTADVVVVELFPATPERAYNRATALDTMGALAAPALVAIAAACGISWRYVLALLGVMAAIYAVAIVSTRLPAPTRSRREDTHWVREIVTSWRDVARHGEARRSLVVLLCFELFEAAFILKYVWLHESVGLSQSTVALYAVGEHVVALVAILAIDRWLAQYQSGRLLRLVSAGLVVLPLLWVVAPGIWGRVLIGIPLALAHATVWPVAKSRSLVAAPQLAGGVQAIAAIFSILPLALVQAQLAEALGIGTAMGATAAIGALLMLVSVRDAGRGPAVAATVT